MKEFENGLFASTSCLDFTLAGALARTKQPGGLDPPGLLSKACRYTHSYFRDRHRRSIIRLSIQRPLPSVHADMVGSCPRSRHRVRTREGLAVARRRGTRPARLPVDREKAVAVRKLVAAGLFPGKVAKQLGIGRSTVYRIVRQCGNTGTPMDVFTSSRPWVDAFTSMPCGPPVQGQNTAKCSGKGRETVKGRRGLGDVSAVPNIHNAHAADAGRIWLRQVETH